MESGFLLIGIKVLDHLIIDFYPCFNGIRVLTDSEEEFLKVATEVSILVLMESGFLLEYAKLSKMAKEFLSLF